MKNSENAILVLADGRVFYGKSAGAIGETSGEVVFNTSMSGYQEILTDPSYAGQMITFTYPHIGNVGVNEDDVESDKVHVTGLIVREMCKEPSNYRATDSLPNYLAKNRIVAISGIDTRALVLHLRNHGSQMGIIFAKVGEISKAEVDQMIHKAKDLPTMDGQDLVPNVSTKKIYEWGEGAWDFTQAKKNCLKGSYVNYSKNDLTNRPHVVAIDFGIKNNILRLLTKSGFRVTVVPAETSAAEIIKLDPQGLFLSNGPGDPAAVTYGIETTKQLLGKYPTFGICLGHQLLGLAVGVPTYKLKFGHRGANHPVKNIKTGRVEISVQNHGFATKSDSISNDVVVTHLNLNDQTIEGIEIPDLNAFSVQHHPECSPGPHDSNYLFEEFFTKVQGFWK